MRLGFTTSNQSQREHQWSGAIPRSKKFKSQQVAGKVIVTVFWDSVGVILVDLMSKRATIILDVYIDTLRKLKARIRIVRSALEMSKALLQHDKARPHTSLKPRDVISSFGWTTTSHSSYFPDLHHLTSICFGPSKKAPQKKFEGATFLQ